MPTRKNPAFGGGFNSPGFAEAAQGLGSLFAPPSGTDVAGFANAAKTKQETQFLTDLYAATQNAARTGDPRGMDPWVFAVGRNFGNTYAGHGMTLQNNLDKQRLENAGLIERTKITDATDRYKSDNERAGRLDVSMATPIAAGATRALPPSMATRYNLPQTQVGVVEVKPGEVSYLPDGRVLQGPAIPLTLDQAQAQAYQTLPGSVQQQRVLAGDGVVAVRDPATGNVVQMSRAEAATRGLTPVDVKEMQQGQNAIDLERAKGVSVSRDGTVVLSPAEAAARGLPQTIQGVQELKPNTSLVVPSVQNGTTTTQTLQGANKPDTLDQAKAAALQDLRQKGVIDDQMMAAILAGNVDLKIVEGPNGPVYSLATGAVGQRAAAAPTNTQKFGSYIVPGPDGRPTPLPARWDSARNVWVDAQTGNPIPAGVQVMEMARPQGSLGEVGAGTAGTIDRQLMNIDVADRMIDEYARLASAPGVQGFAARLVGTVQNVIQQGGELGQSIGAQRELIDQAVRNNAFAPDALARFQNFRTDIPAAEAMRQMLIAQIALATTNDNQVSNRDVERVEQMIGGGDILSNAPDTLARLQTVKANLDMRRQTLGRANTPGSRTWNGTPGVPVPTPTPQPTPGAAPGPRVVQTPGGPVTIERVGP